MVIRVVAVLGVLLASFACTAAPPPNPEPPAQTTAQLRAQLEKILAETHTPGVSVAIVRRDGPEWIDGVGLADVASGAAATGETLFRIGSTSKAFTSLALLQLVEAGKLSFNDPVHQLVPDVWFENPWEATDPVRVVDLLEHTTGWDDMHLREYAKQAPPPMTVRDGLDYDHHSRTSRWRPGTRMAYCNSGLGVAGAIIEAVSGEAFEDYVEHHLFQPIGMRTATYLPPHGVPATTLYHPDGHTPYPYWHVLERPAGAINASARDMAAYLGFYLHRGTVGETAVVPASAIDRMEVPTRTWAAQAGLKAGYGLSNYTTIEDGFVYHGHNGGVNGGLTELAYLPDAGVGYFFSINAGNGDAFKRIGERMRAYVTRGLTKPAVPAAAPLPAAAGDYAGWYVPDSPRIEGMRFLDRLGLIHVAVGPDRLTTTGLDLKHHDWAGTGGGLLRRDDAPSHVDPIASAVLIPPNAEGRFIGFGMSTIRQVSTGAAWLQLALTAVVALSLLSVAAYAPFWLIGGLVPRRRRPAERWMRAWPLVAVLSLVGFVAIFQRSADDLIERFGSPTGWAYALTATTVLFAVAALAAAWAAFRPAGPGVRPAVRRHAQFVAFGLVVATLYLAAYGVIGLRTWV
ncbi:MAG: beta-lactamase family protein [Proteobacteria bacterium]|nr:beta-lactamase family protein [Pseudomonadota bacterium]